MSATQQTQAAVTVRAFVLPYDSEASDAVALVVAELASNAGSGGCQSGRFRSVSTYVMSRPVVR